MTDLLWNEAQQLVFASSLAIALVLLLRPLLRRAFGPELAYLAWAAIGWELVFASVPVGTGLVAAPAPAMLAAMHLAFIALFIAVTTAPDDAKPLQRLLLLGQLALAFVLMALARNHSLPVLLILVAVQVVHLWSPRAALAIIGGTNVRV